MAAVTADTMTLPRVTGAALGDVERPVLAVSTAPAGSFGSASAPSTGSTFVSPFAFERSRIRASISGWMSTASTLPPGATFGATLNVR